MQNEQTLATTTNANAFTSPQALARRIAYDNAMDAMPITVALRQIAQRIPPSRSGATRAPRAPRVHVDARLTTGPNAWESRAPHARTHLAPDGACHHPLVNCVHKW